MCFTIEAELLDSLCAESGLKSILNLTVVAQEFNQAAEWEERGLWISEKNERRRESNYFCSHQCLHRLPLLFLTGYKIMLKLYI